MSTTLQQDSHGEFEHGVLVPGTSQIALRQGVNLASDATTGASYAQQVVVLADKAGVNEASIDSHGSLHTSIVDSTGANKIAIDAEGAVLTTNGGTTTAAVVAGAPGAGVIKASAGRLCKIIVTTTGSAARMLYDNASAASGTIIGAVAASAAVGTVVDCQMPAANGIYAGGATNTPAVTVSYY